MEDRKQFGGWEGSGRLLVERWQGIWKMRLSTEDGKGCGSLKEGVEHKKRCRGRGWFNGWEGT